MQGPARAGFYHRASVTVSASDDLLSHLIIVKPCTLHIDLQHRSLPLTIFDLDQARSAPVDKMSEFKMISMTVAPPVPEGLTVAFDFYGNRRNKHISRVLQTQSTKLLT